MSHADRTRAHERVEGHDPHPDLDFDAIVERDRENLGVGAELSAHAETVDTPILDAMAQAQQTALREVAVAEFPELEGKTQAEIIDFVNQLQISTNPADQQAYVRILNASIARAAEIIEAQGINSNSLGAAITRAVQSAGHNLEGATQDLSQLDTQGILTIVGAGLGGFVLTGSAGWGVGLGGIATAIQSPHLTDATINLARGVGRGAVQVAALPVRGAMRTTDIIAGLGQPGLLDTIQANAVGLGNDVINSIGYTFDGDFDISSNPNSNVLLEEFLRQGEAFAPKELVPLMKYLLEVRNGGPLTRIPTHQELQTAGVFIAQIEDLVSPDEFIAIDERRRAGEVLSNEEKQKYILGKYCMLINNSFIGENALQPQASIVRAAYENETGTLSLQQAFASLSPAELDQLNAANFSWSPQQMANFEGNVNGMEINFENLTKHGFVGLALTAYLSLTYAFMLVQGVKGVYNKGKEAREARAARRRTPDAEKTLSRGERTNLRNSLADKTNKVGAVVAALVAAEVLDSRSDFDSSVRNLTLEELDQDSYDALITLSNDDNTSRAALRDSFFSMLESSNGSLNAEQQENLKARRDYYLYADILNRLDLFYKFAGRGESKVLKLGDQEFTIGTPERGQFQFTTVEQLAQIGNPRNFYRWMTNTGEERTLRMQNPQGNDVYLQLRRNGTDFEFNARDGAGWQTFKLTDLRDSLVGTVTETDEAPTAT